MPSRTRRVSILASLIAAALASNYALIAVPNVKLMDLIVFATGLCFGVVAGAIVGASIWMIYGTVNPYGFVFSTWINVMFWETIYGVAGGILRRAWGADPPRNQTVRAAVFLGSLGFLLTFTYDLMTNVVDAIVLGIPVLLWIISGLYFTLLHEISNAALFALGAIPLASAIRRIAGG